MKNKKEQYEAVVSALSWFIWHYSCIAAAEQHSPVNPPDEMDHLIADASDRVTKIRLLRENFEDTVSGLIR